MTGLPLGRRCIWLWVLPLTASYALWTELGPRYAQDAFSLGIPRLLDVAEAGFRFAAISLSALVVFGWSERRQKLGFALYAVGLIAYLVSYLVVIRAPDGSWAVSRIGFTAPAWTPAVWIAGLWMTAGDALVLPPSLVRWTLAASCAVFVALHIAHANLAYLRSP